MKTNRVRERNAAGQAAMAGWMSIDSRYATELIGHAGFDAVVVDLQHGPYHLDTAIGMLQALSSTPATPMARTPSLDFGTIGKLLDGGAWGIICPMIDTAGQARELVSACRYPPVGIRSFGPARGLLYGGPDYFEKADETIETWAMLETAAGMQNLDAICAVAGLDGVFVGPSDLSIALGLPPMPRWNEGPLAEALARILAAAKAGGKRTGIFCTTKEMSADMRRAGFDLIIPGFDAQHLTTAAKEWLAAARED
jgi:4-hydroxy-2-oxoheptanedioate aldolase